MAAVAVVPAELLVPLAAAQHLLSSAVTAGGSRHVVACTTVAIWRATVGSGPADGEAEAPGEAALIKEVAKEVSMREQASRPLLLQNVLVGANGCDPPVVAGSQRAKRNVGAALHAGLRLRGPAGRPRAVV